VQPIPSVYGCLHHNKLWFGARKRHVLDGQDLRKRTLLERKAALETVLARCPRIKFASHIEDKGEAFYDQVSQLALEGIVCKRADSPYVAGPSRDWVKVKTAAGMRVDDERLRHLRA